MFEKTTETEVTDKGTIWAIPRSKHQISQSEDGCPFYYQIKAGHNEPYQDGAIKLHEFTIMGFLPGGIPLLEKAIETLKQKIEDEQRESAQKVRDMQKRIDSLALIEYKPIEDELIYAGEGPDEEPTEDDLEEADCDPGDMDGDFDSAMASAGHGTDEDYGGGDEKL